jgi:hypothetical protein
MNTNHTTILTRALTITTGLLLAPVLTQAHPGHSAFDPNAAMPHAGHEAEYLVVTGLIAMGAWILTRVWIKRRR